MQETINAAKLSRANTALHECSSSIAVKMTTTEAE
jgi:hypothetical protein